MDKIEKLIFPLGTKVQNSYFIGTVWIETLVTYNKTMNCAIYTFEEGARNNWHRHPGRQILVVTGGKGYYQEEGKSAKIIKEGDVVVIPPNVKHWHGAVPNSFLSHIAITTNPDKGEVEWLEPVDDEYYFQLKFDQ
ncbi:MAG: cupin [Dictyoglomus sp. NZ13-RE01]|nr:MAG: cupin [Dictyoglomus sp. NZ13-RE01]